MIKLTPIVIGNLYDECAETRPHKYCTLNVRGFFTSEHRFDTAQLKKHMRDIQYLLLNLCPDFMHSSAPAGTPWLFARKNSNNEYWCGTLRRAEQLLAMGMALDLVHITHPSASDAISIGDVPFVVVEDERIKKELKLKYK